MRKPSAAGSITVEAFDVGPFLGRVAAAAGERNRDVEAGVPRRFLDRRRAGQDDRVGHRQAAAQLVDLGEHLAELLGLVDRPVLLRSKPDARAIGAAAEVRLAEGRSRRPGRLDQLADAEARVEDLAA